MQDLAVNCINVFQLVWKHIRRQLPSIGHARSASHAQALLDSPQTWRWH